MVAWAFIFLPAPQEVYLRYTYSVPSGFTKKEPPDPRRYIGPSSISHKTFSKT